MTTFRNPEEMAEWLARKNIDASRWGVGGTKSIQNLWDEYVNGEVTFQDNPPMRIVQVVQVLIRRGNYILLEIEQELENSHRRFRNQPPSEKMKAGESTIAAASRCLKEELGLARTDVAFVGSGYERFEAVTESPSYPGLPTRYTFHLVEAVARGLPDEEFWRDNFARGQGDPVKRHLWAWHMRN